MIELPEAATIARQMNETLNGVRIAEGTRGNSPHKFAFYSYSPEEYAAILKGRTIGQVTIHGSLILVSIEPDYVLVLGGGGERILLHENQSTLSKKHQLLLRFEDGRSLTVSVQGWGSVTLSKSTEVANHLYGDPDRISPMSGAFTWDYFRSLFDEIPDEDPRSAKYFMISKPGILGVGNGYLQDILFHAGIHPGEGPWT